MQHTPGANDAKIRPLVADDAPDVADLIRTAFEAIAPPLNPPPSALRETAESVARSIATGGFAMVADGRILGCVLCEPRDGGLYLGRLSVAAGHRRQGVAQALIAAVVARAAAEGYPRVHAGVRLVLAGNRALFAACGFRETALHAHEGFAEPTWVELEKPLV